MLESLTVTRVNKEGPLAFSWNAWSPVNFTIDAGILLGAIIFTFLLAKFLKLFVALAVAFFLNLAIWSIIGFLSPYGLFFVARVLWTSGTVVLPLLLAWFAYRSRRHLLWVPAALLVLCKYYGEVWEPSRLDVARVTIKSDKVLRPIRITHLSDTQTDGITKLYLDARQASNDFHPHLILFTGDVLNHASLIPDLRSYFLGFNQSVGAFAVGGNVDGLLNLSSFLDSCEWTLLDGREKTVSVEGVAVGLMGLGLGDTWNEPLLRSLVADAKGADLRLLLAHYPDALFIAKGKGIDLQLSGHTHGGQVCAPWGPLVTLSRVPNIVGAGGLHVVDGLRVLVSRGLGWEGHVAPRVRTFCRPQITLLEIVPS
jgi:predicted MPP superfamily phosphohydrolase